MCTLIVGIEVLGPGTLVLGANRDESPDRASAGPGILQDHPRIVGGRDLVAGGTWLAVREARAVTAIMNRKPVGPLPTGPLPTALRSRGLLCLDAASAGPAAGAAAAIDPSTGDPYPARLAAARALARRDGYAPFTLVGADLDSGAWWLRSEPGGAETARVLEPGWHVATHADPDDAAEPRTAWLLDRLAEWRPADAEGAFERLAELLRAHGDEGAAAVCLHRDRFPTVSSTLLALGAAGGPRYRHAAGPPCRTRYEDFSALLA